MLAPSPPRIGAPTEAMPGCPSSSLLAQPRLGHGGQLGAQPVGVGDGPAGPGDQLASAASRRSSSVGRQRRQQDLARAGPGGPAAGARPGGRPAACGGSRAVRRRRPRGRRARRRAPSRRSRCRSVVEHRQRGLVQVDVLGDVGCPARTGPARGGTCPVVASCSSSRSAARVATSRCAVLLPSAELAGHLADAELLSAPQKARSTRAALRTEPSSPSGPGAGLAEAVAGRCHRFGVIGHPANLLNVPLCGKIHCDPGLWAPSLTARSRQAQLGVHVAYITGSMSLRTPAGHDAPVAELGGKNASLGIMTSAGHAGASGVRGHR